MKYAIVIMMLIFTAIDTPAQENPTNTPIRTWTNDEERAKEQQQLQTWKNNWNEYLSYKKKVALNVTKSALLPGAAQFSCKKGIKGTFFLGSTVAAAGGAIYFLHKSNDQYSKYKAADNIDDIEKYFNKSEDNLKYSTICLGIGAAIWAINIIDAYFSTISYNQKQFDKFYYGFDQKKPPYNIRLCMSQKQISIDLAYRF